MSSPGRRMPENKRFTQCMVVSAPAVEKKQAEVIFPLTKKLLAHKLQIPLSRQGC
jgi:hypothetical protein